MHQIMIQKKEWNCIYKGSMCAALFLLLSKLGISAMGYLLLIGLYFVLFYAVFGYGISGELSKYLIRKSLRDGDENLAGYERKVLAFYIMTSILGGLFGFLMSGFMAVVMKLPELAILFKVSCIFIPIVSIIRILKDFICVNNGILLFRIVTVLQFICFFVSYYFLKTKILDYGEMVGNILQSENVYGFYGILAILLSFGIGNMIVILLSLVLFLKSLNKSIPLHGKELRRKDSFSALNFYMRELPGTLIKLMFSISGIILVRGCLTTGGMVQKSFWEVGGMTGSFVILTLFLFELVDFTTSSFQTKAVLSVSREDRKGARRNISSCLLYFWLSSIMPVFLILVLKDQIMVILGKEFIGNEIYLGVGTFCLIPVLVVFLCVKIWNLVRPLISICLVLITLLPGVSLYLFKFAKNGAQGLPVFLFGFFFIQAIVFLLLTLREFGTITDVFPKLLLSTIFGAVLAMILLGVKALLYPHLGALITVALCVIVGMFLYWILIFAFHIVSDAEVVNLPVVRSLRTVFSKNRE